MLVLFETFDKLTAQEMLNLNQHTQLYLIVSAASMFTNISTVRRERERERERERDKYCQVCLNIIKVYMHSTFILGLNRKNGIDHH